MNLQELIFDKKVVFTYIPIIRPANMNIAEIADYNFSYKSAIEFAVQYFINNKIERGGLIIETECVCEGLDIINLQEVDSPTMSVKGTDEYEFWAERLRKKSSYITVYDVDGFTEVAKYKLDKNIISDKIENEIGLKFRGDKDEFIEKPVLINSEIPEYWKGEPKNIIPNNRCCLS